MRQAWFALVSLMIGCTATIPVSRTVELPRKIHYPEKSALLTHTGRSTVALIDPMGNGMLKPYCTGTFISNDTILTAAHCVESSIERQSWAGGIAKAIGYKMLYTLEKDVAGLGISPRISYSSTVIKIDSPHDLALLRSDTRSEHDVALIAKYPPSIGSTIYIVGHTARLYYHYMTGTVSQYRERLPDDDRSLSYMEIDSYINLGNSGGAVFNDDGEIAGVVEAISMNTPGIGWCIDIPNIMAFLSKK